MNEISNQWDDLTEMFDPREKNPHVDDNRMVAAPVLMRMIPAQGTGLDFGCGTGWLAAELSQAGYTMEAMNLGPKMLEVARQRFSEHLRLIQGGVEELSQGAPLDFIVAMMVLQFLCTSELEQFAQNAASRVRRGGVLAFATHTHEYLDFAAGQKDMPFEKGKIDLGSGPITIHARTADDYTEIFSTSGWQLTQAQRVAVTEEFHRKHPGAEPLDAPDKFLVMGFQMI